MATVRQFPPVRNRQTKLKPIQRLSYLDRYNLATEPFSLATNPRFAYAAEPQVNAVRSLRNVVLGRSAIGMCSGGVGLGKALDLDTPILTPYGFVPMRKIMVGQCVMGTDGFPHPVTGVFPQGTRPAYRVTFSDGSSTICDDEHLWQVTTTGRAHRGLPPKVLTLREIRETMYLRNGGSRYYIPIAEPMKFPSKALPLDPYLLGALLGDGSFGLGGKASHTRFSSVDEELVEEVRALLPTGTAMREVGSGCDYRFSRGNGHDGRATPNPVSAVLVELGLGTTKSHEKFIPKPYLFAGLEQRIALLQGLMDTDGYAGDRATEFCTTSKQLADDVRFLVESLGGIARRKIKSAPTYIHNGEKRIGRTAYRLNIKLPMGMPLFRLGRKVEAHIAPTKYGPSRAIRKVEYIGEREMQCISVASPDHLFVIEHCIVTHNTTLARLLYEDLENDTIPVIYLPTVPGDRRQSEAALFNAIIDQFHLKRDRSGSATAHLQRLADFAAENAAAGSTTVVLIDEAQQTRPPAARGLGQLLALQDSNTQLFQVILFGQNPAMIDVLRERENEGLLSRLSAHVELRPFSQEEVGAMINYRLGLAGRETPLLTDEAIKFLTFASRGVPRDICQIGNKACVIADAEGVEMIDVQHIEAAASELLRTGLLA